MARVKLCMVKDCKRVAIARGQCAVCYRDSRKAVSEGRTTWKELEKKKVALPPRVSLLLSAIGLKPSKGK